jgi:hypothetical protein
MAADGEKLLLFRTSKDLMSGDIYESSLINGQWSNPQILGSNVNSNGNIESSACYSKDNDLIIFSEDSLDKSDSQFTKTLIHEKIHLYQKQYPNDVQTYLSHNNIVKLKKRVYNDYIRANPDLDDWIYKDKNTGFIFKCEYNSKFPKHILDVKNTNQLFEHPFEKMAVEISSRFKYQ